MGQSISTRVEFSPFSASAPDGSQAFLLSKSLANEDLLHDLVRYIDYLVQHYPNEAKLEFRKPLYYITNTLKSSMFVNDRSFNVISPVKQGVIVHSVNSRADGLSFLFQMELTSANTFVVKVSNFENLNKILSFAGDLKLREAQDILQANREILTLITGFSAVDAAATMMEAVEAIKQDTDHAKREQHVRSLKLLSILNGFDLKMLAAAAKKENTASQVTMSEVEQELLMLQSFCGKKKDKALISIIYDSDYIFANGCRTPPWRQIYGELCYLTIVAHDRDRLNVTASKNGVFLNKGYCTTAGGEEELNYEKDGEIYPSLTALLRAQSPHFAATVDKQDFSFKPSTKPKIEVPIAKGEAANLPAPGVQSNVDDDGRHAANTETGDERTAPALARKATDYNAFKTQQVASNGRKKKKGVKKHQSTLGPSAKWRYINVAHNDDHEKTKPSKSQSHRALDIIARRQHARSRKFDEDSETSDGEAGYTTEEESTKRQETSDLPAEYWQIQKLVKYLRVGNQTATIIAICVLRDFDLHAEANQLAIRDVGGLEILVNLLDTEDPRCIRGALHVLKDISQNVHIRAAVSELDAIAPMVELLDDPSEEIKCLAAETLANCAKYDINRRLVRRYGGIKKLVRLLKSRNEEVSRCGASALCSSSKSVKNKQAIEAAGAIPLLAKLMQSKNVNLLIPVVGILQECATDEKYRIAIRTNGLIKFLVENLANSKNIELQTHCASAIFKCAEDEETRLLVQKFNGIEPLASLLDNPNANKELLVAVTGAIWKCSQNKDTVTQFIKLGTFKRICQMMDSQPEEVLVNMVGALGACAQLPEGRSAIRESNGITPLVNLLTRTDSALLVNVTKAVGACSHDTDCMATIDRLDGVRLLWSLLKSPNPAVQASAAWAISPCIEHAKDAGEMVRSFVGGLELIVSLLKSDNTEVLASVCAALANIANDEENLAVITDHGVVPMLAKLSTTKDDRLKKNLAEAIARCCHWGLNRVAFGSAKAVAPVVKFLKSPDKEVHRSTALALHQLSMDPDNCITMHENGVVPLLLSMVGSADEVLQEAAAGTISNIRKLALASEKAALI